MFSSLRQQALFFAISTMIIAAFVIVFISYFHDRHEVKKTADFFSNEILNMIELSIIDNHDYLIDSRYRYVNFLKKRLKLAVIRSVSFYKAANAITGDLQSVLNKYYKSSDDINFEYRWNRIADIILNYPDRSSDIDWLIIDKNGNVLKTTNNSFEFINIGKDFIDVSDKKNFGGKYYGKSLIKSGDSGQLVVFENKNIMNIGYFAPLPYDKFVHPSYEEMTIAAFVNITLFKSKEIEKIDEIKKAISRIVSKVTILNHGFAFVLDNEYCPINKSIKIESLRYEIKKTYSQLDFTKNIVKIPSFSIEKEDHVVYTKYFDGFDGWYISIAVPKDELVRPAKELAKKQLIVIAIIFAICIILLVWRIYVATAPLEILSKKMEKVPGHDFISNDNTELIEGLPVATKNEIGRLAQAFTFMINQLSGSIKKLVETTAANERIESELNLARKIQLGIVPTDFSFEPERKALDIHADLIPAKEIGGDLYDFFFIDDDHLCFTVGDVAGKGIPAALFMVIAKKMINHNAHAGGGNISPAEIMNQINEIIYKDNPDSTFVTLFIGILNVKTGELRYANGGHVPPIFMDCSSDPYYRKDRSGPAPGALSGIKYKEILTALSPGGAVFLCTDGVTEAMDETDALFGDNRLLENFARIKDESCRNVIESILHEVRTHAGTAPQSDDIAMLMVRWGVDKSRN